LASLVFVKEAEGFTLDRDEELSADMPHNFLLHVRLDIPKKVEH
jgi:hypothetical protein